MSEDLKEPSQSFEFICQWFKNAEKNAREQGRHESALLWKDGLKQLKYYHAIATRPASGLVEWPEKYTGIDAECEEGRIFNHAIDLCKAAYQKAGGKKIDRKRLAKALEKLSYDSSIHPKDYLRVADAVLREVGE